MERWVGEGSRSFVSRPKARARQAEKQLIQAGQKVIVEDSPLFTTEHLTSSCLRTLG